MLRKISGPFREFGPAAGLLYAIDRVLSILSPGLRLYFYELIVQPTPDKPLLPGAFAKQLEVREIKAGDPELALMPVRPDAMQDRFAQNAVCLGAFRKDALIGYMWFCARAYNEDEVRCTYILGPERESVFDFDFYLFPEHRMGLGFVGLWNGANEFLNRRGIRYTFSRLTRFNLTSRRAPQHFGWEKVGRAPLFRVWRVPGLGGAPFPLVPLSRDSGRRGLPVLHAPRA